VLARLDAELGGGAEPAEAEVLAAFEAYVARELARGTPLRAMTRHLLGMRSGRDGGRRWRRELGQLGDGGHGFAALCSLVREFTAGPALTAA
jgi:tRNA-dihydrouridine synthase A